MKVFISAVSGDMQYVASIKSLFELEREAGDELFIEFRTRGDVARESMLEAFLKRKEFDVLLMLDADQSHPKSLLKQLRATMEAQDLDMVCAHYYRRETALIQSLCYELTGDGTYPFIPLLDMPRAGVHEIALTGMGCVLIQRRVLEAVQATLPEGMSAFAIGTLPNEANDHQNWGTDFRFFIMARRLGYRLWLDANVESLHAVTLWLGHKSADKLMNYTKWADGTHELWEERIKLHGMNIEALKQRDRILEAREKGLNQTAEQVNMARQNAKNEEDMKAALDAATEVSLAMYEVWGRRKEIAAWIEVIAKYPQVVTPDQLPTTETWEKQDHSAEGTTPEEIAKIRGDMYRHNAADIVSELPELKGNGRR